MRIHKLLLVTLSLALPLSSGTASNPRSVTYDGPGAAEPQDPGPEDPDDDLSPPDTVLAGMAFSVSIPPICLAGIN